MLKTLAGLYFDEGQDRDAVLVYARLIQEKPVSVEAPFFQSHIVTCVARMGRKDAAVQQAHVFAKLLRDVEASPDGKDPKNARFLADARADAERTLRILAVQYHNEWKKTRRRAGGRLRRRPSTATTSSSSPASHPPTRCASSTPSCSTRWASSRRPAPTTSRWRWRTSRPSDKQGKPGKFLNDALENAVFAYDVVASKLPKVQPGDAQEADRDGPGPPQAGGGLRALPQVRAQGRQVGRGRLQGGHALLHAQRLRRGQRPLHPHRARPPQARAGPVLRQPGARRLQPAGRLAQRERLGEALLRQQGPARRRTRSSRTTWPASSSRAPSRSSRSASGPRTGTRPPRSYLAFARDWPASKLAATALYNASVDQVRAGRLDRAMEIRDQFLQRYPADPLAVKCLYDNAEAFEAIGDFGEAADRYERYFAGWRKASQPETRAPARCRPREEGEGRPPRRRQGRRAGGQAGLRGEEGQRRHHQRGRVPGRAARLGPRRGRQPGLPRDLARRRRRRPHLPLAGRPVPPPRADAEGARAAGGVPAAPRQGPRRVARHPGPHGQALREERERSPGPPRLRAGPRLLPPALGRREGPRARRWWRRRSTWRWSPTSRPTSGSP